MKRAGRERKREGRWVVVVAEDTDDYALLIERALERAAAVPVEIHRAHNGFEALTLAKKVSPDLLLLDLRMPWRGGHEVLETLKGHEELRRIPVAVLTSSDREEDMARSYGLGGNHFITKPSDPAELERKLRILLANLSELPGIRRGAAGLDRSAVSAVSPATLAFRRIGIWIVAGALLAALIAFAWLSGAFS